jgi:signal transduction histidine kinase
MFNLIIYSTLIVIVIAIALLLVFNIALKQKRNSLIEKQAAELTFISELNKTKQEIQDQTLTYIGRELHDNIGQLLTISKIHSNALIRNDAENKKLVALDEMLDKAIVEIKQLSKSLDSSRIADFGFHKELLLEVSRINNTKVATVQLQVEGVENLDPGKAIILYRILQEFISNAMKYSHCDTINISLTYTPEFLQVHVHDNGIGFDMNSVKKGSGLNNIQNRITLLQAADVQFTSQSNIGTSLLFKIPINSIE